MYNTVSGKTIAFLGWAFKKDTNDTRESAAIYVADMLIEEQATIKVYDPKVTGTQMLNDLDYLNTRSQKENASFLQTNERPIQSPRRAHTQWPYLQSGMSLKATIGRLFTMPCKSPPLCLMGVIF